MVNENEDEKGLTEDLETLSATAEILRFFKYAHLQPRLREVSMQFAKIAVWIVRNTNRSAEQSVALRKLLESKDAAVRAAL